MTDELRVLTEIRDLVASWRICTIVAIFLLFGLFTIQLGKVAGWWN